MEKIDAIVVSIGSVLNSSILATLNVKDSDVLILLGPDKALAGLQE